MFNQIKNQSLYADKWRGLYRKASEIGRDIEAIGMIRIAEARLRAFARVARRGGSRKRFADRPELPAMLEEIERAAETGVGGGAQQAREADALIGFASSLAADAPPLMQIEPDQIATLLTVGLHQNLSCSVRSVPFLE